MNKETYLKQATRAFEQTDTMKKIVDDHHQIVIIGNGGSNAISSHISQDYTKQLKKQSFSFSDPSRLTCYINDYGMENAYRQFISEFVAEDNCVVILLSSSGESMNIVNCANWCIDNNIPFVSLTGFKPNNALRALSTFSKQCLLEFHVESEDYGIVECVHELLLHSIL